MVHVTTGTFPADLGDDVTVGHSAVIHGCTIKDRCLIGIGAIVLDGAVVGPDAMVGAGAVVTPGTVVPPACWCSARRPGEAPAHRRREGSSSARLGRPLRRAGRALPRGRMGGTR